MFFNQILGRLAQPMGVGGMRMGGYGIEEPFRATYRAFPVAAANKEKLEAGDKIILPPSALDHLTRIHVQYPMLFKISPSASSSSSPSPSSSSPPRFTHCGVMEFSSEEGVVYLPFWMMQNLLIEVGGLVDVQNIKLPTGNFVKLQPHNTAFTQLHNPRVVLEKALRGFTCLTKGDTIAIQHGTENFLLDVVEVKPGTAISVIETDVNVEFAPPKDMKETPQPPPSSSSSLSSSASSSSSSSSIPSSSKPGEHFHFKTHDSHTGHEVKKTDFLSSSSSSSTIDNGKKDTSGTIGGNDYFSKLGGGYKLKNGKKIEENKSNNSNNNNNSSNNNNNTAVGGPPVKKTISEVEGRFEYIYEVEGDKKRLIRRIPVRMNSTSMIPSTTTNNNNNNGNNKTTTTTNNNKSDGKTGGAAASSSLSTPSPAICGGSVSSNPFAGKKGYSLK